MSALLSEGRIRDYQWRRDALAGSVQGLGCQDSLLPARGLCGNAPYGTTHFPTPPGGTAMTRLLALLAVLTGAALTPGDPATGQGKKDPPAAGKKHVVVMVENTYK